MSVNTETNSSPLDFLKLIIAVGLMVVAVGLFYYLANYPLYQRVLVLLAVLGVAGFIGMQTNSGRRLWQFASGAKLEVHKVVWPTRQETIQTTIVVFVMVFVLALLIWLFDIVLLAGLRWLTGTA